MSKSALYPQVIVKDHVKQKIKSYFPWVYDNECLSISNSIPDGSLVEVATKQGQSIGIAYMNRKSKITLRILSFFNMVMIDNNFIRKKLSSAIALRKGSYDQFSAIRLFHSEADGIPGLIIDKYNDTIVIQFNTLGIEPFREIIIASIKDLLSPSTIFEKSDHISRAKEGLESYDQFIYGPQNDEILITENGIQFKVDLTASQKTGFFLDQRRNRMLIADLVSTKTSVLDLFCYTGGFGLYCMAKGVSDISFLDISRESLALLEENLKLNHFKMPNIICENAFDFLSREKNKTMCYDLIICDPPAFSKSLSKKENALRGYKELMLNCMKLANDNGYIAFFSCSHHISQLDLVEIAYEAASDVGRQFIIQEFLYQDKDHPVLLPFPPSLYLNGLLLKAVF